MIKRIIENRKYLDRPGRVFDFGEEKWAALFFNRGGPETSDDVGDYLYRIFSDRNAIEMPFSFILQKPLARLLAGRRTSRVAKRYHAVDGSPFLMWTRLAASGVKRELSKKYPHVEVFAGMRYSEPFIPEELDSAVGEGCRHIMLISMYPHYSRATTGSALDEIADWLDDAEEDISISLIEEWSGRSRYISLLRKRIDAAMDQVDDRSKTALIFVGTAIPKKLDASGDPNVSQLKKTAALAGEGFNYELAFQSRFGPVKWVGPDVLTVVNRLAREGIEELVLVPISYVTDHLGTLYKIDIQLKEAAMKAGIKSLFRTESLNDDADFVDFLANLIEEKIKDSKEA
jgi:ferrochelatase